jgi:hypothetical protein
VKGAYREVRTGRDIWRVVDTGGYRRRDAGKICASPHALCEDQRTKTTNVEGLHNLQ